MANNGVNVQEQTSSGVIRVELDVGQGLPAVARTTFNPDTFTSENGLRSPGEQVVQAVDRIGEIGHRVSIYVEHNQASTGGEVVTVTGYFAGNTEVELSQEPHGI